MTDTVDTKDLGNTKPSQRRNRGRSWALTINNFDEKNVQPYIDTLTQRGSMYILGREVGKEGTPHLQCYVRFKNAISFNTIKEIFPTAHIEKAKGNLKQNIEYCSKEGDFETNVDLIPFQEKINKLIIENEYKDIVWKPWQKEILEKIQKIPDKRKVHWYWENIGNTGKSFLVKYLAMTEKIILADGKSRDIFNQVKVMMDQKMIPKIIILDIPRTNLEYINYSALELLKNGTVYSGKYEGGLLIFPIPHVFVFANREPNVNKLSEDRWDIQDVKDLVDNQVGD